MLESMRNEFSMNVSMGRRRHSEKMCVLQSCREYHTREMIRDDPGYPIVVFWRERSMVEKMIPTP